MGFASQPVKKSMRRADAIRAIDLFRFRFGLLFNRFTTREEEQFRRHRGAARPRFHTHVYTHGSRHRRHSGLPRPPIKGRLVVLCDADRLATGLFLVPFLSAASIPRGPVPGDPLNHHVEVGTTQECVRAWRPRAVAFPPRRPRLAPKDRRCYVPRHK